MPRPGEADADVDTIFSSNRLAMLSPLFHAGHDEMSSCVVWWLRLRRHDRAIQCTERIVTASGLHPWVTNELSFCTRCPRHGRWPAVVALESTVIAQGLPWPENLETAQAVMAAVRDAGAVPATIAVLDGVIRVGLDDSEIVS